uniref:Uncharacterized protein n=1 Tax=Lepeophtheirus salmonis TaxID=72036 RepID=A0A0K2VF01_LEPSM
MTSLYLKIQMMSCFKQFICKISLDRSFVGPNKAEFFYETGPDQDLLLDQTNFVQQKI